MNPEILSSLEYIEKERGIRKEVLIEALRQALFSACRKTFAGQENFDIQIDPHSFQIQLLKDGKPIHDPDFGRIAAQTAKQVIIQKIREAERESVFGEFSKREGDVVTGSVHRVDKKAILVDLGKAEGILPSREQSPQDFYKQGHVIRAYVLEVKKTSKGPEVILSRAHAGLVVRLFESEVPEIHDEIVQIKAAAREAGSRTKIAVYSSDDKIDCVGSCVGVRGQRVKNIVNELGGEKIDIIRYSTDMEAYIRNAMAPAELAEVHLNPQAKSAEILVQDDQLSLAIGKKGQNVRLASKLLGWRLDVRSMSQRISLAALEGVGEKNAELLKEIGIASVKDLLKAKPEDLMKIQGIGEKTAEKILAAAQKAVAEQGGKTLEGEKVEPSKPAATEEHSEENSETNESMN